MNLREAARGRPCQIRIPGVCVDDRATTVLAHYRLNGGVGLKPPDICGAWACSWCHDAVDRRTHLELEYEYVRHCHAEGVLRTLAALVAKGYQFERSREEDAAAYD